MDPDFEADDEAIGIAGIAYSNVDREDVLGSARRLAAFAAERAGDRTIVLGGRDLVREAQEELADAANYLAWEFRAHDTSVHQALGAVVQAWAALEEVRRHG
jgi:hypothetical protein